MTKSEWLKEYRVISTLSLVFVSYILYIVIEWITGFGKEGLEAMSMGGGVAITGILGSITALYEIVFRHARFKLEKSEN